MAKKIDKKKKPAYGERPEPVKCEPCEPEPMRVEEVKDNG